MGIQVNDIGPDGPVCINCGDFGKGAEFKIFSEYGFGNFCVKCEELVDSKALSIIREQHEGGESNGCVQK